MPRTHTGMYADILRTDLAAFIHRAFIELNGGTPYLDNWHVDLIASKLEQVRGGQCKRLILNVPPRHLKSFATSIAFPAWILGHDPSKQVMFITYGQDLSENFAAKARTLMESDLYTGLFDTRLASRALSELTTTRGGSLFSTSMSGAVTGRGADIIIIDDPLKADDALSDARRTAVNTTYDNTVRSRFNSPAQGALVLVMQRLHCDDLVAHVQSQEPWDVVSLPALADCDERHEFRTPFGRRVVTRMEGEALHPAQLSSETLSNIRRAMTEYNFEAQYQQNPQPASGLVVKREWLKFYNSAEMPKFDRILQSWDTANKDSELANFSVCTTWGLTDKRAYLLDVFRRKMDFPALKVAVKAQAQLHSVTVVLIEDKASGTSLLQELRAEGFSICQPAPSSDGDKIMRLRAQTAKISSGAVLFPKEAAWLDVYLTELLSFPNAKNDDQVDSTVYALAWMTANPEPGIIQYYRELAELAQGKGPKFRYRPTDSTSHYQTYDVDTGQSRMVTCEPDGTFLLTEKEARPVLARGWVKVEG